MLSKVLKGLVAGGALLGMVAGAQAATYDINIYGASAQHKFWLNLADDWLAAQGCSLVQKADKDKKHGISVGTGCTVNGTSGHTINFRYSSQSSMTGVVAVQSGTQQLMVDKSTCTFATAPNVGTCTGLTATTVNLGASDVAWDEFDQNTKGYEDGNLAVDVFADPPVATTDFPIVPRPTVSPDDEFNPIVVPFGFIVNDTVCKFRCVKPHTWADANGNGLVDDGPVTAAAYSAIPTYAHKAYSHDMWECDPTQSDAAGHNEQCVGYFKCIDTDGDGTETCQGGVNNGNTCTTSSDCPDVNVADTRCEAMPIDNINTTMAGLIFSGKVKYWKDFGPYYDCKIDADGDGANDDDLAVFAAMRHAGSGTHSTVTDLLAPYALATGDDYSGNLMVGDSQYPQGYNRIHYESSSDLTSAVCDFAGGIGYVDADKLIAFKDITDGMADGPTVGYDEADDIIGAHLVKYNGVEPTRQKIVNCEYEFWSPQHCYYMNAAWSSPAMSSLLTSLRSFSTNKDNLNSTTLGVSADYWAAQGEMTKCGKVKKTNVTKMIIQ